MKIFEFVVGQLKMKQVYEINLYWKLRNGNHKLIKKIRQEFKPKDDQLTILTKEFGCDLVTWETFLAFGV